MAGLSLAPPALARAAAASALHRWRGVALGAEASIVLHHPDGAAARRLIASCVDEIARLERVFSLYRADSALSRLNRFGALEAPPSALVQLLDDCRRFNRITGGAFDATVQPLWRLYADHFSQEDADPSGPGPAALARARALVDQRSVAVDPAHVSFARPGMAITLNGIAQGFATDRVAALLRAGGGAAQSGGGSPPPGSGALCSGHGASSGGMSPASMRSMNSTSARRASSSVA